MGESKEWDECAGAGVVACLSTSLKTFEEFQTLAWENIKLTSKHVWGRRVGQGSAELVSFSCEAGIKCAGADLGNPLGLFRGSKLSPRLDRGHVGDRREGCLHEKMALRFGAPLAIWSFDGRLPFGLVRASRVGKKCILEGHTHATVLWQLWVIQVIPDTNAVVIAEFRGDA